MDLVTIAIQAWFGRVLDLRRNERGLSQSTENAILLAGAIAVAGIVIAAVTAYVTARMPS